MFLYTIIYKFINIFRYIGARSGFACRKFKISRIKRKKYAQCLLPWVTKQIERDPEIPSCLNNPIYRDKNSTLMRLYNSATYAYKSFLHSTVNLFRSPEGFGWERGIFGISINDRAVLRSDDLKSISVKWKDGFSVSTTNKTDLIMPFPNWSEWGRECVRPLMTQKAIEVSNNINLIYYCIRLKNLIYMSI